MFFTLKKFLLRLLQNHRQGPLARRIGSVARTIHRAFEHPGYDFATNGEEGVICTLRDFDLRLALDVGANHGDWTRLLLRHHPACTVHAFEVAPRTYQILQEQMRADQRLHLHQLGLGAHTAPMAFRYYGDADELTTATYHMDHLSSQTISARIQRGEEWAREENIERADLLKIDVEGMELDVLEGFGDLTQRGAFRFIQFEHHIGRALLHDFYALLVPAGYRIGKIYSRYVEFHDYDIALEDGIGPNFLAVHGSEAAAIARLARGWENYDALDGIDSAPSAQ